MWSRVPRRIFHAMLLLFSWVAVPLVLVETAMIVLEPYLFSGFYQYDPHIGFRVRPYYGGTNRFGFNDRDYSLQREAGIFRVLVVGDSFGWAGGMDGNYTALLEQKLSAATPGHRVEVINAGYPGTHTGEQLLMLEKYGLKYEPDLVVLGFFAGNDFLDADPHRKRIIVNDIYIDIDKRKEMTLFGYPIIANSRLLMFVQQKYKLFTESFRNRKHAHAITGEDGSPRGTFAEDTFLGIEAARMSFCNLEDFREGKHAANIAFVFDSLRKMRDLLQGRRIPFVVAIFPDEFQVDDHLAAVLFGKFNFDPRNYDLGLMQKILRGFLEAESIPYVDLLPRFRETGKQESLYLLRDTHWNDAGNRLAATILQERLLPVVETFFESGGKSSIR